MKSKSILTKFLIVLAPVYLVLVLVGSFIAAQVLIRDNTDLLTSRVGSLAARVSLALDIHEAYAYDTLAQDLIAPLGVDEAVVCVEFRSADGSNVIAAHPPTLGCVGQSNAPFEAEIPVDDYDEYNLHLKFTDAAITAAVKKQIIITASVLLFAFIITLVSAAIGFKAIVSSRLLALHDAIRMAADNLQRQRVQSTGYDELAEIIKAYNTLMDQDAVRERQLTAANEILTRQSKQDHLTGLYNRRFFSTMVTENSPATPVSGAIMLMDVDHFKKINDVHGHAAGDEVLVALAGRITNCLPDETPVVRWGGEEILVYLSNLGYDEVNSFATMLLNAVGATPVTTKSGDIKVTTSIGIVRLPFSCGGQTLLPEESVNLADAALYKAKSAGRNCAIAIAEQSLASEDAIAVVEKDFEKALKEGLIHTETLHGPPQRNSSYSVVTPITSATPKAA
jgi:diguanylate cyclase (GGDEF)-like protein